MMVLKESNVHYLQNPQLKFKDSEFEVESIHQLLSLHIARDKPDIDVMTTVAKPSESHELAGRIGCRDQDPLRQALRV